ncbi:MAG TPA: aldehyde dehydrogenase, partial [Gemmatimonadales bacterium]|nr:aldehyde dehydrogenase [Gemmatimonadales bacterium]
DRTPKLFIGGKQVRPDQGYSRKVAGPSGEVVGEVGDGNRKDIRDAVEAAHKASGWGRGSGHARAQVLYYVAENLSARAEEFARRIAAQTGVSSDAAAGEVTASISRLFTYAAWADKYDGAIHHVPIRGVTLAMPEPIGVIGIAAPAANPLLGFVSLVAPAVATGNTVVAIPSPTHPLSATDFYGVLETSDVPDGVINIVTGDRDPLIKVLAEHLDVDAVWYWGTAAGVKAVEEASAGNMKRTWASDQTAHALDWLDPAWGEGQEFLRHATQVKNIWIPYGE